MQNCQCTSEWASTTQKTVQWMSHARHVTSFSILQGWGVQPGISKRCYYSWIHSTCYIGGREKPALDFSCNQHQRLNNGVRFPWFAFEDLKTHNEMNDFISHTKVISGIQQFKFPSMSRSIFKNWTLEPPTVVSCLERTDGVWLAGIASECIGELENLW